MIYISLSLFSNTIQMGLIAWTLPPFNGFEPKAHKSLTFHICVQLGVWVLLAKSNVRLPRWERKRWLANHRYEQQFSNTNSSPPQQDDEQDTQSQLVGCPPGRALRCRKAIWTGVHTCKHIAIANPLQKYTTIGKPQPPNEYRNLLYAYSTHASHAHIYTTPRTPTRSSQCVRLLALREHI